MKAICKGYSHGQIFGGPKGSLQIIFKETTWKEIGMLIKCTMTSWVLEMFMSNPLPCILSTLHYLIFFSKICNNEYDMLHCIKSKTEYDSLADREAVKYSNCIISTIQCSAVMHQ